MVRPAGASLRRRAMTMPEVAPSGPAPMVAVPEAGIGTPITSVPMRVDVWRRFRKNKLAVLGLAFILLLVFVAIFQSWIAPSSYKQVNIGANTLRQPPSLKHYFGTDDLGRDVYSRVVYG